MGKQEINFKILTIKKKKKKTCSNQDKQKIAVGCFLLKRSKYNSHELWAHLTCANLQKAKIRRKYFPTIT